jgi:hypothetical protein
LLEIDRTPHDGRKFNLVKRLAAARSRLSSDPSLIDQALAALKFKSVAVDPEVVRALKTGVVVIETGLVQYAGRFVCDGLVSRILWLGKNYRNNFNRAYQAIRSEGRFYSRYGS